jgi:membrane-associated two-gene conflict system component 1 (EACC1)
VLAEIQVDGSNAASDGEDLWDWLRRERGLTGRVARISKAPGPTDLGGLIDVLTVALGSGGVAAVLAQSLSAWLTSRRSNVTVTVTTAAGTVTVSAADIARGDVLPLLKQVLPSDDAETT